MVGKQLNLIYALKNEKIVSIADVERGLNCGCVCPACGETLVARKGTKVAHHFSHKAGSSCEYGYETSLHLAAKDILSKVKKMFIPAVYVQFHSHRNHILISEAIEIDIERVELEKRFNEMVPDVVVYSKGKAIFVEIYVTHRIGKDKESKIKKANVSAIEIDLSKRSSITTPEELSDILLGDSKEKKWVYNAVANKYLQRFYQVSDRRKVVPRGLALHVDYCPIKSRIWHGKPYANFFDDCLDCKYCIDAASRDTILCSGEQRIAELEDFQISHEERIEKYE